jgi:hypothetical protein
MTQNTGPLSLRKRMAFSFLLAVLLLAILEAGSGVVLRVTQGYDGDHLLQYEFDPYKNILPTRGYRDLRGVVHNEQGFRREGTVPVSKAEDTYRIFLMGASTAYGTGGLWTHLQRDYKVLQNSETIDAYLEQELARMFPSSRIEVINAAIPSVWTHHHLIYLNQSILKFKPDMVLFLDGFNDHFFFGEDHDQFASYAYGEHAVTIMGQPTLRALATANGWWLLRKSAFAHLLMRSTRDLKLLLQRKPERLPIDVDRALAQVETNFEQNALAMVERTSLIVQHAGARPVFLLQPLLILERTRLGMPEIERRLFEFNVESALPGYEPLMLRAVPLVSSRLEASIDRVGGSYLDLTGIYTDAGEQIFTDYCHLTPTGNRILAGHVARHIASQIEADMDDRLVPLPADGRRAAF